MRRSRPGVTIHIIDGPPAISTGLWIIHPDDSQHLGKHVVALSEFGEIVTRPFTEDPWTVCDELIDDDFEPVTITNGVSIMAYRPTIQGAITDDSHWYGLTIPIPEEWQ